MACLTALQALELRANATTDIRPAGICRELAYLGIDNLPLVHPADTTLMAMRDPGRGMQLDCARLRVWVQLWREEVCVCVCVCGRAGVRACVCARARFRA